MATTDMNAMVQYVKVISDTTTNSDFKSWWNLENLKGKIFRVVHLSSYGYVKVEYNTENYEWLPLRICELVGAEELTQSAD